MPAVVVSDQPEDAAGTRPAWTTYRVLLLVLGTWMGLCGGTLYAFSSFEIEIIRTCNINAEELDTVYACGQFGVGLGILAGILYDNFGPVTTSLYGMVMTLIGNIGLTLLLRRPGCGGLGGLGTLYFCLQNGSSAIYQVGLFANLRASPPSHQGAVAGIVASGYGLSSALFTTVYQSFCGSQLQPYLRWTGITFGVTAFVAAMIVPRLITLAEGISSQPYGPLQDDPEQSEQARQHEMAAAAGQTGKSSVVHRLPHPIAPPGSAASITPSIVGTATPAEESPHSGPGYRCPGCAPQELSLRTILKAPDLWLFVATFSFLNSVGSGLFIANLSLMSQSLGVDAPTRLTYVKVVSYCNCLGRLLTGCFMDALTQRGMPKAAHTVWTATVMICTVVLLRTLPDSMMQAVLLPALLAVGFTYGANWAIMPAFVAGRFGNANVGVCFNVNATLLAVAVLGMSSVAGSFYDAVAVSSSSTTPGPGEPLFCTGARCWRSAYSLALLLCCLGLCTAIVLTLRELRHHRLTTSAT